MQTGEKYAIVIDNILGKKGRTTMKKCLICFLAALGLCCALTAEPQRAVRGNELTQTQQKRHG